MNIDDVKVDAARFKDRRLLRERVEKFISPRYFSDVNLFSKLYPEKKDFDELLYLSPKSTAETAIQYHEAVQRFLDLKDSDYHNAQANIGQSFGPTWTTHWFMAKFKIPKHWATKEVHFRWNSSSEAMIWMDGRPAQGLSGDDDQPRMDFVLPKKGTDEDSSFTLYIEMAANGMFGAGKDGMINPPEQGRQFTLKMAHIAVFDRQAYNVIRDLDLLIEGSKELANDDPMALEYLMVANQVVDCFQPATQDSYSRAHNALRTVFGSQNNRAGDSMVSVSAVGNCHIDTAWLWPYSETRRKCGRSWTCAINIAKEKEFFKFAISQAQQLAWVKEDYPTLFKDLQNFYKRGQICMVGGTWVEMDGNIPSGESFVRQFLHGQYFFKDEFGKFCSVFWLPDTFGYSAQLPQIVRGAGIKYFLSQKLSWNLFNTFPHNTFIWEGIDGSRCLAHFPPASTYSSDAKPNDVLKTVKKNKDSGVVHDGMLLYGYGDGGGGPTEEMVDRLNRMNDMKGFPRVHFPSPEDFFATVEKESADHLHTWTGELYLELHQGTLTTHAQVKKQNRMCEFALRDAEFISSLIWTKTGSYASKQLKKAWELLLLNQFHDVLPGSSIEAVYKDAHRYYEEIHHCCTQVMKNALKHSYQGDDEQGLGLFINSFSWPRREVVRIPSDTVERSAKRGRLEVSENGGTGNQTFEMVSVPAMSLCKHHTETDVGPLSLTIKGEGFSMENKHLAVTFDLSGRMCSLRHLGTNREVLSDYGNQLVLFNDIPLYWDAWDVMPYYKHSRQPLVADSKSSVYAEVDERLRKSVKVVLHFGESGKVTQTITLDADSPYVKFSLKVDWYENRKLLRVEFPTTIMNDFATYDIQFGSIRRPTHTNTSWDAAKFEVCGHKWMDLSEYDFGVALLSDSKYGYSVSKNVIGMSLLRSPKAPDANADMGVHEFAYAIMPHAGSFQSANVIQESYNFSHPMEFLSGYSHTDLPVDPLFTVSHPAVIIEAVKKAERKNALVVRLYEAYGGRASFRLSSPLHIRSITRCDLLENPCKGENVSTWDPSLGYSMTLKPYEIASLLIELHS